jgi:hypothetical protein
MVFKLRYFVVSLPLQAMLVFKANSQVLYGKYRTVLKIWYFVVSISLYTMLVFKANSKLLVMVFFLLDVLVHFYDLKLVY